MDQTKVQSEKLPCPSSIPLRLLIYLIGVVTVSLGIVLCKKCGLGISPISSIPFVLEKIVPLSFGTLTMLFHLVNICLQLLLMRKLFDARIYMQIPLAFLFGWVIDLLQKCIRFNEELLFNQIAALVFSVFFTALGMLCMLSMNLIQNPPDGTVRLISQNQKKELGQIKIRYDVVCVIISILIGLVFLKSITGFGIATIVSAVFVGKTLTWLKRLLHWTINRLQTKKA